MDTLLFIHVDFVVGVGIKRFPKLNRQIKFEESLISQKSGIVDKIWGLIFFNTQKKGFFSFGLIGSIVSNGYWWGKSTWFHFYQCTSIRTIWL